MRGARGCGSERTPRPPHPAARAPLTAPKALLPTRVELYFLPSPFYLFFFNFPNFGGLEDARGAVLAVAGSPRGSSQRRGLLPPPAHRHRFLEVLEQQLLPRMGEGSFGQRCSRGACRKGGSCPRLDTGIKTQWGCSETFPWRWCVSILHTMVPCFGWGRWPKGWWEGGGQWWEVRCRWLRCRRTCFA